MAFGGFQKDPLVVAIHISNKLCTKIEDSMDMG
jgi:hypothetical protein